MMKTFDDCEIKHQSTKVYLKFCEPEKMTFCTSRIILQCALKEYQSMKSIT